MITNLNFGEAITALHSGKRISREGWNGKGLFVFKQIPAEVDIDIIPSMSSLPQSVKDEFIKRNNSIKYLNQMCIVYPDNTIYGWTPSPSDALSNDWCILD